MRFAFTTLQCRLGRRQIEPAIHRRAGAEPGQSHQIPTQPLAQRATAYSGMDDPFATERTAQLRRGQDACRGQIASARAQFAAPGFGAIDRKKQQRGSAAAHRFADPIEPGHCEAGATGEAERITTTLRQQGLDAVSETGRGQDRLPRGARKDPLGQCSIHYIPPRRQPQTPSGQPRGDIRHERPIGSDDKAQQRAAILALAGDDAAALWRAGCRG
jgi:hypothetical protein